MSDDDQQVSPDGGGRGNGSGRHSGGGPASTDRFWDGFLLGLERGAGQAYDVGYADAEATLQQVVAGFLQVNPPRQIIRAMEAKAARENAMRKPLDPRTPEQVRHDAYLSWGIDPPADTDDTTTIDAERTGVSTDLPDDETTRSGTADRADDEVDDLADADGTGW